MINFVSAQSYFVYECPEFSVMFKCNSANTQIIDVQFSSKDSKGQWQWNKFNVTDYESFEDSETGGFIFYCTDGGRRSYAVDYYRDEDYIIVHAITSGALSKEWKLLRRDD